MRGAKVAYQTEIGRKASLVMKEPGCKGGCVAIPSGHLERGQTKGGVRRRGGERVAGGTSGRGGNQIEDQGGPGC